MRGSQSHCDAVAIATGIIPAHAGLTAMQLTAAIESRDHPRACGAHAAARRLTTTHTGSSPRMRGSRRKSPCMAGSSGIIPAHAGLTLVRSRSAQRLRDHPRACGAHQKIDVAVKWNMGSSPRMRGSRQERHPRQRRGGIIPAHAGLTPR